MYAQKEKPKENKSRAVANSVVQKKSNGEQSFGFVDNRSEAITLRKLNTIVSNSPQIKSLQMKGKVNINSDIGFEKKINVIRNNIKQKNPEDNLPSNITPEVINSLDSSPIIQGRWILNESGNEYKTEALYDGVRWFGISMDYIYFIIENESGIKIGAVEDYKNLQGKEKARSWDEWNSISVTPFESLDEIPESNPTEEPTFERTIYMIEQGLQHFPSKKAALAEIGIDIKRLNSKHVYYTLNKELAKGNPKVVGKLLEKSEVTVNKKHIQHVMSQFKGMDISDAGEDKETSAILTGYTLSEFEYVTAFVRGTVWSKAYKKSMHADAATRLKGAKFLARMNNAWENGPAADVAYTWRTENKTYGEISKGGLNREYQKGNPASTSVNIIPPRADKQENMLLRISNLKKGIVGFRQPIDLRKYSQYPGEGEILYPAFTKYTTDGVTKKQGSYNYVDVSATPPDFKFAQSEVEKDIIEKLKNPPIDQSIEGYPDENGYNNLYQDYIRQ